MKLSVTSLVAFAAVTMNIQQVQAGPVAMGLCYSACNTGYVTCCTAAGVTAGTFTLGLGVPAALLGCSAVQGACMAACTPLLAAPSP
ncbi:transmembrane protein [Ceratobasidium sp. AG-Ba]|nr:transmembrane protein [Ceratobasidium sp. AG-Ba]QRW05086.1 transmembrane protein [Ceratobasidium sp. AG-Ba]